MLIPRFRDARYLSKNACFAVSYAFETVFYLFLFFLIPFSLLKKTNLFPSPEGKMVHPFLSPERKRNPQKTIKLQASSTVVRPVRLRDSGSVFWACLFSRRRWPTVAQAWGAAGAIAFKEKNVTGLKCGTTSESHDTSNGYGKKSNRSILEIVKKAPDSRPELCPV